MQPRVTLPADLQATLPLDTARAWQTLAPMLPKELYLVGGTAIAVHLKHRESRDLDFFFHSNAVDLDALAAELQKLSRFSVTRQGAGTLCGVLGETKVEFFHADEGGTQHLLEEPTIVSGLRIAGLKDLMAMKLKVIGDRGELRDYFDVKLIEEAGHITVEDGLALYLGRHGLTPQHETIDHIIRALGYLDDVIEDDMLPMSKHDLAAWWKTRQARLIRNLSRSTP